MKGLHLHGVSHAFDGNRVLDNVSLTVPAGELVCLLGPSGCGKTTLLRISAGLERLQQGSVVIDETLVADAKTHMPPEQRKIGLMFQDYALFPHLSALANVTFGLNDVKSAAARRRAMDVLHQVGMTSHAEKYPHMLSGGQQQRVALSRALAPDPRLLLLDEPFSGLDATMRVQIREETLQILKQSGVATMMVTHDPEEAMFMADRVKILVEGGRVLQSGRPSEIYHEPANEFVASLFGTVNRFDGLVSDGAVATPFGRVPSNGFDEGAPVRVLIRPEGLILGRGEVDSGVPVEVLSTHLLGRSSQVRLRSTSTGNGEDKNMAGGRDGFDAYVSADFDPVVEGGLSVRIDTRYAFIYAKNQG